MDFYDNDIVLFTQSRHPRIEQPSMAEEFCLIYENCDDKSLIYVVAKNLSTPQNKFIKKLTPSEQFVTHNPPLHSVQCVGSSKHRGNSSSKSIKKFNAMGSKFKLIQRWFNVLLDHIYILNKNFCFTALCWFWQFAVSINCQRIKWCCFKCNEIT